MNQAQRPNDHRASGQYVPPQAILPHRKVPLRTKTSRDDSLHIREIHEIFNGARYTSDTTTRHKKTGRLT